MKEDRNSVQRKNYSIRSGKILGSIRILDIPYSVNDDFRENILKDEAGYALYIHLAPIGSDLAWSIISREISKVIPEVETSGNIISRELEKRKIERENLELLKNKITSGEAKLYSFNSVIEFQETPHRIRETKNSIKKDLRRINVKGESKIYNDLRYISEIEKERSFYIESSSLSEILPINRGYLLERNGIYIGLDAKTNSPVFLDRYRLPSSHQMVSGMTGFGKSYFVKAMLFREKVVNNPEIVIIDPMGEYGKISQNMNLKEIDIANGGLNIFSPLYFMNAKENTERIISLLSLLFNLTENDRGVLDAEFTKFYEHSHSLKDLMDGIQAKNKETFNKISPIFEGSLKTFSTEGDINFNGSGRINLGKIPKPLLPFYMLLSLELAMRQKSGERKILVLDEVHYLLDDRTVITLERYIRHARHDNISIIMISQSANDFFKSKYTVSILENCSIHILLRHQNVTEQMGEFYHLDENLKFFLKYSAGFNGEDTLSYFQIPGFRGIVKINSTKDEYDQIE